MAWLKIDDGMAENPKILKLSRSDRWTWVELLCYVARQNNGGHIHDRVTQVLPRVTTGYLAKCEAVGLVDITDDGRLAVHDWDVYNPKDRTAAERQRRYRSRDKT
jgi:hypothetical protein